MIKRQVLIPVTMQGYTGQREQFETFDQEWVINLESDDTVQILQPGSIARRLRFNRKDFLDAMEALSK